MKTENLRLRWIVAGGHGGPVLACFNQQFQAFLHSPFHGRLFPACGLHWQPAFMLKWRLFFYNWEHTWMRRGHSWTLTQLLIGCSKQFLVKLFPWLNRQGARQPRGKSQSGLWISAGFGSASVPIFAATQLWGRCRQTILTFPDFFYYKRFCTCIRCQVALQSRSGLSRHSIVCFFLHLTRHTTLLARGSYISEIHTTHLRTICSSLLCCCAQFKNFYSTILLVLWLFTFLISKTSRDAHSFWGGNP